MGPRVVVSFALVGAGVGALLGLAGMALLSGTPMKGSWWPVSWLAQLGAITAGFAVLLLSVAWTRRARALAAEGLQEPPAPPRRRWWQTLVVAPLYFLLLFVLTPVWLWFGMQNLTGAWAWRSARAALVQRGEPMTFSALLGPQPAEDANLAMTPLLRPAHDLQLVVTNGRTHVVWADPQGRDRVRAMWIPTAVEDKKPEDGKVVRDSRPNLLALARGIRAAPMRQAKDLSVPAEIAGRYGISTNRVEVMDKEEARALEITEPARVVLTFLERYDVEMREMTRAAASRPASDFLGLRQAEDLVLLPHLAPMKGMGALFRARCAARLESGDARGAWEDAMTLVRLSAKSAPDPVVIALLVRFASTTVGVAAVWDGVTRRAWDDGQLSALQQELASLDLQRGALRALQGERIVQNVMMDAYARGRFALAVMLTEEVVPAEGSSLRGPIPGLFPSGMMRRNQVHVNRLTDVLLQWTADPRHARVLESEDSRDRADQVDWRQSGARRGLTGKLAREAGMDPANPNNILAAMTVPALERVPLMVARHEAMVRMAILACALERHRLRTGAFPAELASLVPSLIEQLPGDPMAEGTFRYELRPDGTFRLWSVGPDGADDAGAMQERQREGKGADWTWPDPQPSTDPRLF